MPENIYTHFSSNWKYGSLSLKVLPIQLRLSVTSITDYMYNVSRVVSVRMNVPIA